MKNSGTGKWLFLYIQGVSEKVDIATLRRLLVHPKNKSDIGKQGDLVY